MNLSFVHLFGFVDQCRRLRLTDDDIRELETLLDQRPQAGNVIPGTGGLRKLRFSPSQWNRGKSGATRVCYVYFQIASIIVFVSVYAKNEQSDLSPRQKALLAKVIQNLREELGGKT